ncbi:MAG: BlaI/MecI/CopY family transcriptional regulator [Sedimentisphaerales bacterium]|nr:BlaI/MecI/CopY family transcriptional regulator [Sedimentisphaerales bacterium]
MTRKPLNNLGQLQRAVIEVVWELGEANVHQVRERLCRQKQLAYTTVLTAMQNLEKAGWLRHRKEGKSHIYLPTKTREQAGASSLKRFMKQVFDGDAMLMFQHLIRQSSLSDKDLQELHDIINEAGKEKQK